MTYLIKTYHYTPTDPSSTISVLLVQGKSNLKISLLQRNWSFPLFLQKLTSLFAERSSVAWKPTTAADTVSTNCNFYNYNEKNVKFENNHVDDGIPAFMKLKSASDIVYMPVVDITSKKVQGTSNCF